MVRGSAVHSASPDEEKRPWRGNRETCCHTASLTITRISNSHLFFFVIYQVCIYALSQVGRLIYVGVVKHLFSSKQCT